MKKSIIIGFIIYGLAVGFIAVWWRQYADSIFLLNIPGTLLGDEAYILSIRLLGDPHSAQAHYTIPWLFRIPQVYVPVSILFWGFFGIVIAAFIKLGIIGWIIRVPSSLRGLFSCHRL
jgi:hypothetical protein